MLVVEVEEGEDTSLVDSTTSFSAGSMKGWLLDSGCFDELSNVSPSTVFELSAVGSLITSSPVATVLPVFASTDGLVSPSETVELESDEDSADGELAPDDSLLPDAVLELPASDTLTPSESVTSARASGPGV